MPTKTDPRVDAYIAEAAPFAQPILRQLRSLVHEACPEAEETMKWSFPHFMAHGAILCSMAAFKAHAVFGFWHKDMIAVIGAAGSDADSAMGSFGRITSRADLPNDRTMTRYIRAAAKLNASGTPGRARGKKKPELAVPPDLARVLKRTPAAAKTFEGFSPSHRREYIEWITEAKRPETRQKRLVTAVEWLTQGKQRHWKYENC